MNDKRNAMLRLSSVQFAAWELHMYLDTHPFDKDVSKKYNEYMKLYKVLLANFEEKYGPITQPADGVEWLKDPWPWDVIKECDC